MSTDTLDPPPPPPPGGETVPTNGNPQHGYFSRKCKIYTLLRNNYRSYKVYIELGINRNCVVLI